MNLTRSQRSILAKFRLGALHIRVEAGRYTNVGLTGYKGTKDYVWYVMKGILRMNIM